MKSDKKRGPGGGGGGGPRKQRGGAELTMAKFLELRDMKLSQAARAFGMGVTQARPRPRPLSAPHAVR